MPTALKSEREREVLPETARHELVVDDALDSTRSPGTGPSWVMPVALFGGLLLTLILSRIGISFFFLPIILPMGLGGGRLLRQFFPAGRRVLRLQDGLLWLASEGAWSTSTLGRVEVSSGAFLSLTTTGVFVDGLEEAALRVVTSRGALTVSVRGGERARTLGHELADLFEQDGVSLLDADGALQGEVVVEPYDSGSQITWSLPLRAAGFLGGRPETALRVTPDAWALRVRAGQRVLVSTGGPGALRARRVPADHTDHQGASVARDAELLALFVEDENVGRVGAELSEPEQRFVAERIEHAATLRH
jgi:hypothetical protein